VPCANLNPSLNPNLVQGLTGGCGGTDEEAGGEGGVGKDSVTGFSGDALGDDFVPDEPGSKVRVRRYRVCA
jgi:hypothetical protein